MMTTEDLLNSRDILMLGKKTSILLEN